ncbi:FAD-dependent urate hydroxylase HpyO FAD/NAD(P)-binding domain-containing protein [Vibrio crassostreae]|nr:FAD-dependent urate hydroxylase HpyO FAD/NAD(P)-binding domain-containing protein [Vibrio crassostreae]CAK3505005.1 FAD-dependent urate hydroxylase HpyO FAD/NAD(P)-binding domain-containing protein [Vibrio crassostreae]
MSLEFGFDHITIIDPLGVCKGSGFSTFSDKMLCNTPVNLNSVDGNNLLDFYQYCIRMGHPHKKEDFAPRSLFLEYVVSKFEEYLGLFESRGGCIEFVKDKAVAIDYVDKEVLTKESGHHIFGNCIICLGPTRPSGYGIESDSLPEIKSATIFGSKLSAIDLAIFLCSKGIKVEMVSPSGELPNVRSRLHESAPSGSSIEELVRQVSKESKDKSYANLSVAEKLNKDISDSESNQWQDLISCGLQEIMNNGSPYLERLLALAPQIVKRYICSFPYQNALLVQQYMSGGLLSISKGNKSAYKRNAVDGHLFVDGGDSLFPTLTVGGNLIYIRYMESAEVGLDVGDLTKYGIYTSGSLNREVDLVVNYIRYITQDNHKKIKAMNIKREFASENMCG